MEFFKPFLQPGSLLLWRSLTPHCARARGELGSRDPRLGLFLTASARSLGARKDLVHRGEQIMTRAAVQGHDVFSRSFVCKGGNPLHFEEPVQTLVTRAAGCHVDKKIFDASLKSFQTKHGLPNKRATLVKTRTKTAVRRRWRRGVLTSRCFSRGRESA